MPCPQDEGYINEWYRVLDESKHAQQRHLDRLRQEREATEQERAVKRRQAQAHAIKNEAASKIQANEATRFCPLTATTVAQRMVRARFARNALSHKRWINLNVRSVAVEQVLVTLCTLPHFSVMT